MDDMGNTGTDYFSIQEPADKVLERRAQQNKLQAGKALLDDVIKRLEERITFYDSLDSIDIDIETSPEAHKTEVITGQKTKLNLIIEKEYFQALRDSIK